MVYGMVHVSLVQLRCIERKVDTYMTSIYGADIGYTLLILHFFGFCAQGNADEWKGDEDEKQRRLLAVKNHSYMFQSYDATVTQLYAERFPWIGARNRVVVCTRKTAMSLKLALLLKRLMTTGKYSRAKVLISIIDSPCVICGHSIMLRDIS